MSTPHIRFSLAALLLTGLASFALAALPAPQPPTARVVGQPGHLLAARAVGRPVRLEAELLVGPGEAVEEV